MIPSNVKQNTNNTANRLTLLRLHLCDFLEPVPPHLTVTWLMGLAKALPADREGNKQRIRYSTTQ